MAESFKVGEVVKLKSGGLKMTVCEVDGNNITCSWTQDKKVESSTFPSAALEIAKMGISAVAISRASGPTSRGGRL